MTNQEVIRKKFALLRERVAEGGRAGLCEQMERTMQQSINLHMVLEDGAHRHHTLESDSHGWAVADKGKLVKSGASELEMSNLYGSAEEDASREAARDSANQVGVFSAVMGDYDSARFEEKLHELLMVSAHQDFIVYFRRNYKPVSKR